MFYDMAVKQRHSTGVGGYWYKSLAVTARMAQCHVFPRERLLLQDDEDSVLRTEAVSEESWTSARQYRMSCSRPHKGQLAAGPLALAITELVDAQFLDAEL